MTKIFPSCCTATYSLYRYGGMTMLPEKIPTKLQRAARCGDSSKNYKAANCNWNMKGANTDSWWEHKHWTEMATDEYIMFMCCVLCLYCCFCFCCAWCSHLAVVFLCCCFCFCCCWCSHPAVVFLHCCFCLCCCWCSHPEVVFLFCCFSFCCGWCSHFAVMLAHYYNSKKLKCCTHSNISYKSHVA